MINDGEIEVEEGRQCLTYDYTGSVIGIITVYKKLIQNEIQLVRSLTGMRGGGRVEDRQMVGILYDDDKLKKTRQMDVGVMESAVAYCRTMV
jgi:hypothetical protein